MAISVLRKEVGQIIRQLPEAELYAIKRYAEFLASQAENPVLRALRNAPISDEPLTDEERAGLERAREDEKAGRIISHAELKRRLRGSE